MDNLPAKIHALLFAEGGGLTYASLKKTLLCDDAALSAALDTVSSSLSNTGITLVRSDTEATLAISDSARDIVMQKAAEETSRDIGEAGLEVLAIVLYEGPSTRADIEYIRGVNSSTSIRNLLTRGLIERAGNPADAREYVYRPTTELLAHLGVENRENLPDYGIIARELATFKAGQEAIGPIGPIGPSNNHESGTTTKSSS